MAMRKPTTENASAPWRYMSLATMALPEKATAPANAQINPCVRRSCERACKGEVKVANDMPGTLPENPDAAG
jgi:hypothetical protein